MGLDLYAHKNGKPIKHIHIGSYSSFNNYRTILAKNFGINLKNMEGFVGTYNFGEYIQFKELLNHSDCEGELIHSEIINLLKDFNTYTKLEMSEYTQLHKRLYLFIKFACKNWCIIKFS